MFECLTNESQRNFGSGCWHDKVSIVEKGFPDLENATEPLAYKSKPFAKSLPRKKGLFKLSIRDMVCFSVRHSQEYLPCIFAVLSSCCQAAWKGEHSNN